MPKESTMVGNRETALRNLVKANARVAEIIKQEGIQSIAEPLPIVHLLVSQEAPALRQALTFRSWQKTCQSCGEPNPDFKDETICVDCQRPLGSKETAVLLPRCPYCGGRRLKLKKPLP